MHSSNWVDYRSWVDFIRVNFIKVDLLVVDFMISWYCKSWSRGSWSYKSWSRVRIPLYPTIDGVLATPLVCVCAVSMSKCVLWLQNVDIFGQAPFRNRRSHCMHTTTLQESLTTFTLWSNLLRLVWHFSLYPHSPHVADSFLYRVASCSIKSFVSSVKSSGTSTLH